MSYSPLPAAQIGAWSQPCDLPLPGVSLVVVNHNYGGFIGETLQSIRQQTYPWTECLIVDNGSTDNSLAVVRDHVGDDPRFEIVALDRNYGHLGAALQILGRLKSEFVCFVDADDILFPQFLAAHVQVHLAGPEMVALTSSNVVEIDSGGRLLNGGMPWLVRSGGVPGFRTPDCSPALPMLSPEEHRKLASATSYFDASRLLWLWGPGTSNMYRRSIISMIAPQGFSEPMEGGVDCFLNYFSHALTGSSLISMPLSAYRIHGSNHHARRPSLWGVYPGMPHNRHVDNTITTWKAGLFLERTTALAFILGARFWTALDVLGAREFRTPAAYHGSLLPAYIAHYPLLVRQFGAAKVETELRLRLAWRDHLHLQRKVHSGVSLLAFGSRMLAIEWRHRHIRLRYRLRLRSRLKRLLGLFRRPPAALQSRAG